MSNNQDVQVLQDNLKEARRLIEEVLGVLSASVGRSQPLYVSPEIIGLTLKLIDLCKQIRTIEDVWKQQNV